MNQKQNEDLDSMIDEFLNVVKENYSTYYYHKRWRKIYAFYFVGKKRDKFPNNENKQPFEDIGAITNSVHNYFCVKLRFMSYIYFPYFNILKQDSNYHFHFLIYKKIIFILRNFIWKIAE